MSNKIISTSLSQNQWYTVCLNIIPNKNENFIHGWITTEKHSCQYLFIGNMYMPQYKMDYAVKH